MIEGGPVAAYLSELRRQLPYPAPRLLAETREHLLDAVARGVACGRSQEDAESDAVQQFGPAAQVASSVLDDGSALMSPRVVRWLTPIGMLLCLPAFVFLAVNLIESLAGNSGGEGVFGTTLDEWRSQVSAVLVLGPPVALALVTVTGIRVHRDRGAAGFSATAELRMSRAAMWTGAAAAVVSAALLGYLVVDNYGTWRDFHNASWTCTTTSQGRQLCVQGELTPQELRRLDVRS